MDNTNELEQQLTRYLQFIRQDPDNLQLLITISNTYRLLNDFTTAQFYLDKAKIIDANACIALEGLLALNQGHFQEAKEAFLIALSFEDLDILHYSLAVCYYSLQEPEEGLAILTPLLYSNDIAYDVALLQAQLVSQQGNFDEAIKLLTIMIEKHGSTEETLAILTQLYFENQQEILAQNAAKKVLAINPNNYEAQVVLLLISLANGNAPLAQVKKLLKQEPNDSRLWFALGTIYVQKTEFNDAETAYLQAIELNANYYDYWIHLAWCQLLLNKITEAQNCYHHAITLDEQCAEGWGGLALIYALQEKSLEAATLINKAKELDEACFLIDIAQIICFQYTDSDKAAKQFKHSFPTIAEQLSAAMNLVLEKSESEVLH